MSREPRQDARIVFFIARHGYAAVVALVFVAITIIALLGLSLGAWAASGSPKPFILALGFAGVVYWLWFSNQSV